METLRIYYDGDCVFCTNYVRMLRLKAIFKSVELYSIREDLVAARRFTEMGFNPNAGMIVERDGEIIHGADAINYLATITTPVGVFNRLSARILLHSRLAKVIYPVLKAGRVGLLLLLGRGLLAPEIEHELTAKLGRRSAALTLLRLALFLIPVAAILLIVLHLSGALPFSLESREVIALSMTIVLGAAAVTATLWRPRLTGIVFLRMWDLDCRILAAYFALLLLPAFVFEVTFFRRIFAGLIFLPMVGFAYDMFRLHFAEAKGRRIALFFPLAFAVMAAVPGFILPPYYQGIAGWIAHAAKAPANTSIVGYDLVNDKGQSVWVTHDLFDPVTQVGRFWKAWNTRAERLGPIEPFIMQAYRRDYQLLSAGYMPYQKYLGPFAYPPHTFPADLPDYRDFPPDRIKRIRFVEKTFDRSGKMVKTTVLTDIELNKR